MTPVMTTTILSLIHIFSAVLALALIVQIKRRTGTLDAADLAQLRH